jgi:hypothetical protein
MANVSGKDGSITFATGYVVDTTEWTVDAAAEEVETTALGDKWKTWIAGVKEWSGSYTALADDTLVATSGTVGVAGGTGFNLGNAAATATFKFGSNDSLTGTIFITGASANAAIGGTASSFTFTFRGTSTLSHGS